MDKKNKKLDHIVAGGVSGLATCIILQPLDLIKTRLQQQLNTSHHGLFSLFKQILSTENSIRSLWRGTWPTIFRNVPGNALYFGSLNEIKTGLSLYTSLPQGFIHLLSGISSRVLVGTLLMPMTVLKIRFESNYYDYKSLQGAFKDILSKEGWRGLFIGLGPTILRDAPYAGIYFYFYENYKSMLSSSIHSLVVLNTVAGSLSGLTSTIVTQPFDLIKSRMQLKPQIYTHFLSSARKIAIEEGFRGYLSGFIPRVLRKTLNSVIAWTVYEQMCIVLKKD